MNYGIVCEKYMCVCFIRIEQNEFYADKSSARSSLLNTHTLVTLAIVCRDMACANAIAENIVSKEHIRFVFTFAYGICIESPLKITMLTIISYNSRRFGVYASRMIAATAATAAMHAQRVNAIW